MKVCIIGGGLTGLTAGLELTRRGFTAEVFEKMKGVSSLSKAMGINAHSLKLLKPSGVAKDLFEQGVSYKGLKIYEGDKPVSSISFDTSNGQSETFIGLPKNKIEHLVREKFLSLGGTLHFDKEVRHVNQTANDVTITTHKGEKVVCDYALGADGTHSIVRKSLGVGYHGYDLDDIWSIADVEINNWSHNDVVTLFLLGNGKISLIAPLGDGRYRLVSNTENALEVVPVPITVIKIHRQGQFDINVRQVKAYSKGRIFLAGNTAHCHSLVGGRGMNLGIYNAFLFARLLEEDNLCFYESLCHEEGLAAIASCERMRKAITSTGLMHRLLLTGVKRLLPIHAIQRKIIREVVSGE